MRIARLGVGATFQSLWAYPEPSVTDFAVPLLGEERAYSMYSIGSVHRSGGRIVGGSERVDWATMIEAYTINGAYMMELDDKQGSIEVGKRADFIVLDRNLFAIPVYEINEAKVVLTVFAGEVVYEAINQ